MKLSTKSRLDSLVSTTALSFTVAVLVCLSLSLSDVDLKEFPKLRDLQIRAHSMLILRVSRAGEEMPSKAWHLASMPAQTKQP
ncbi:unnamed protein product [Penicillium nalgiovense]|nr:unnamed protein product [Penicillium nalgiovense]